MNAQEALNEIVKLFDQMDLPEDYTKFIELKDGFASLQQLIDQSNAKPKTLEELGWIKEMDGIEITGYSNNYKHIYFDEHINTVRVYTELSTSIISTILQPEEILAIAEKMKELGMTK